MGRKLDHLLDLRPIRVVHPVAAELWIVKQTAAGGKVFRRKSPKRGIAADVCMELVSFPSLLSHPHFTLDVALVRMEEVRQPRARGRKRLGVHERRLIDVVEVVSFSTPHDLLQLVPAGLPDPFTTADLAVALGRSRHAAQAVAYCLRESDAVAVAGRDRRGVLYRRPPLAAAS